MLLIALLNVYVGILDDRPSDCLWGKMRRSAVADAKRLRHKAAALFIPFPFCPATHASLGPLLIRWFYKKYVCNENRFRKQDVQNE